MLNVYLWKMLSCIFKKSIKLVLLTSFTLHVSNNAYHDALLKDNHHDSLTMYITNNEPSSHCAIHAKHKNPNFI